MAVVNDPYSQPVNVAADEPMAPPPGFVEQTPPQVTVQQPIKQTQQTQQVSQPVQPAQPVQKPTQINPDNLEFNPTDKDPGDTTPQDQQPAVDLDQIIKEQADAVNSGEVESKNVDKLPLAVPLSTAEALTEAMTRELTSDPSRVREKLADLISSYNTMERAQQAFSNQFTLMTDSLKRLEKPEEKLKRSVSGVGDANAALSSKYRGQKVINLTDTDAFMMMATMTGGMRRITLWNSGFSVTLRELPLTLLNNYYNNVNTRDYEYGKQFGAFYYYFADLAIKQYIIENLFPAAICSSSYAHWRDTEKLLSAISFQDFDTIVWGMACMMHPNGASVHFACANPGCDHVEAVLSDLTKLRLVNYDLVNEEMVKHFRVPGTFNDESLQKYRDASNLKSSVTFEYGTGPAWRKWKLNLRQISLADHINVGKDFNTELAKHCRINNNREVIEYNTYNIYRSYKPWIESIEMTFDHGEGEQTAILKNTEEEGVREAFYVALENISKNCKDFDKKMEEYITSTKLSHIAYYMPKCPACGTVPEVGYHGYIPYDAMRNFFTLALMRLLQERVDSESENSSNDTNNS